MFSQTSKTNLVRLTLGAAFLLAMGARGGDSDVVVSSTEESSIQVAGIGLPSAAMVTTVAGANDGDEPASAPAERGRRRGPRDEGQPFLHRFLAEASGFLDHDQMIALTNLVAEMREDFAGPGIGPHGSGALGRGRGMGRGDCSAGRRGVRQGQGPGPRAGQDLVADLADELDLTEEQRVRLEELRSERRAGRREAADARRAGRHAGQIDFLSEVLDLSESQRAAVAALLEEREATANEMREGFRSSVDDSGVRPSEEVRAAHRAAMDALRAETHAGILEVLDEEQAELFESLGKLRPQRGSHHGRGGRR